MYGPLKEEFVAGEVCEGGKEKVTCHFGGKYVQVLVIRSTCVGGTGGP